jgi:hypothetical protein
VDQAAEPVASSDAGIGGRWRFVNLALGWSLAECPVRPVGAVVVDVFATGEDIVVYGLTTGLVRARAAPGHVR